MDDLPVGVSGSVGSVVPPPPDEPPSTNVSTSALLYVSSLMRQPFSSYKKDDISC